MRMLEAMVLRVSVLIGDLTRAKLTRNQNSILRWAFGVQVTSPYQNADRRRFSVNRERRNPWRCQTEDAIASVRAAMRPLAMMATARWQHGAIDHKRPTSCATHFARTSAPESAKDLISATCVVIRSTLEAGRRNSFKRESIMIPRYLTRDAGHKRHFYTEIVRPHDVAS